MKIIFIIYAAIFCAVVCFAVPRGTRADGAASGAASSVSAGAILFSQTDDSTPSSGSWYSDNWYQLGRGFAGTVTSITLEGMVDGPAEASLLLLKEFGDSGYRNLLNTYTISGSAPFTPTGFTKATFSDLNIPLDPNHYYRLDTFEGRQNESVILAGIPGIGTAMSDSFVYGTGRVEGYYPFYPYIAIDGNFFEPLVVVPGVMGSELVDATGKEYWPDVTDMVNSDDDSYLDALKLASDGTQIPGNEMTAPDIIREATGTYNRLFIPIPLHQAIFDNLVKTFTDVGYVEGENLFVAPYDWRLSVASSAVAVGDVIQAAAAASPDGKVNVIAHSMGGLVVKDYLATLANNVTRIVVSDAIGQTDTVAASSPIDKLIFTGVPQLGAPFVFKGLQYGDNLGFTVGPFDLLNPDEVKAIVQNMPGVYDLLPSRRFVDVDGPYILQQTMDDAGNVSTQALSFNDANAFMTSDPNGTGNARNGGLLSAADDFHAALDSTSISSADASEIFNIVGCQNPTPEQYVIHDDGTVDINRSNGDGSVPVDSAMNLADGYQNYFILNSENGVDHEGLIRDPQPLALMQAIIQETTSTLALQSLGISTSLEDCVEGRGAPRPSAVEVNVSGSSTVDVYDSSGDHVGLNDAGDIDLQIPGSSYDVVGNSTIVTLPATSTPYKVTVKKSSAKTSAAKTTLTVKSYDTTAKVTASTTYTGVSLETPSSTATLTVQIPMTSVLASASTSASTSTPAQPIITMLSVDEAGAGATSTVIEPDADADQDGPHSPLVCVKI